MTQATVSIVRPEEAHAEFGKLADRRRRLLEREADLIQRGGQAQAQGRVDLTDRLGAELRSIRAELDGLQLDFTATEFDAKEASRARLLADKNYRGLVKLAAEALAARLALWVPLCKPSPRRGRSVSWSPRCPSACWPSSPRRGPGRRSRCRMACWTRRRSPRHWRSWWG